MRAAARLVAPGAPWDALCGAQRRFL